MIHTKKTVLKSLFPSLSSCNHQTVRFASKKSGGSTSNGRTSNPKFLGFKKMHNSQVGPGNIIIRQRGTEWHPGMNVGMGKDHTIFALKAGTVSLHYDIFRQRRLISVDDSSSSPLSLSSLTALDASEKPLHNSLKTALMPTKQEMKQRLKDMIDVKLYLSLDPKGRYDHVQEKLKELKELTDKEKNAALKEKLKMNGTRKLKFCDLSLV